MRILTDMSRHFRPGSRNAKVYTWLRENPGYHQPQDVGVALDLTTHQAAVALNNLLGRGLVTRESSKYSVPERIVQHPAWEDEA